MNRGPPGAFEGGPHAYPPWHGPYHRPSHHRGLPDCFSRSGPSDFDLDQFLSNLRDRCGVEITSTAEGLGWSRFAAPRSNNEAEFEPRADVFDTPAAYVVHASLFGAQSSHHGIDWDGEHSILGLAEVIHRPDADEELLEQLAVNGSKREVGVFEKKHPTGHQT